MTVAAGDLGANDRQLHVHEQVADDGDRDDVTVRIGANVRMQQPSSRVVGDTVLLGNASAVYNVLDNFLINKTAAVLGTIASPVTLPYWRCPPSRR